MEAKLELADRIVARYHGIESARTAKAEFQQKFQDREFPAEPDARITVTGADVPDASAPALSLLDLVVRTKLLPSKGEARRLIAQGGVELDDQKQTDSNATVSLTPGRQYRLRIGRRKFAVIEFRP